MTQKEVQEIRKQIKELKGKIKAHEKVTVRVRNARVEWRDGYWKIMYKPLVGGRNYVTLAFASVEEYSEEETLKQIAIDFDLLAKEIQQKRAAREI